MKGPVAPPGGMPRGPLRIDLREPYRARLSPVPESVNIPLGVLLAEPERLRPGERVVMLSDRPEQADFAARHFRERGVDAIAQP